MTDLEERVRAALRAQAETLTASSDAWHGVAARAGGRQARLSSRTARQRVAARLQPLAACAAVVALGICIAAVIWPGRHGSTGSGLAGSSRAASTATASGTPAARAISIHTIAYRSAAAMTKAVSGDSGILYLQIVPPASWGVATIKEWTLGLSQREQIYDSSGALTDDFSAVVSQGQRIRRNVSYSQGVWTTDSIPEDQVGTLPPVTQEVVQLFGGDGSTPAGTVTTVTVAGRKMLKLTVDGSGSLIAASRLVISRLEVLPAATANVETPIPAALPGSTSTTIWIDAASYLPVRIVAASPTGQAVLTVTFAMLPLTPANLAMLTPAPVPAGFRLVP